MVTSTPPHHLYISATAPSNKTTTIATPPPTETPSTMSTTPAPPAEPPSKVVSVRVTSSVLNALPAQPVNMTLPLPTQPPLPSKVMGVLVTPAVPPSTSTMVISSSTITTARSMPTPTTEPKTSAPTAPPLSKVSGVRVTPSVMNMSPTLTVRWQTLASGAVTYTVKYSTQQGEVNTPPEGALEVIGISGTSTILTGLERATTYYIWVVGVSEGGEGPHSDRMSGETYDSELHSTNSAYRSLGPHKVMSQRLMLQ